MAATATLHDSELAALRDLVERRTVQGASDILQIAPGTTTRALARLPIARTTATHIRAGLAEFARGGAGR